MRSQQASNPAEKNGDATEEMCMCHRLLSGSSHQQRVRSMLPALIFCVFSVFFFFFSSVAFCQMLISIVYACIIIGRFSRHLFSRRLLAAPLWMLCADIESMSPRFVVRPRYAGDV
jgi:hypothetical protein